MYKKVLYNIKKLKKKMWGEGEGRYLNPKHSLKYSTHHSLSADTGFKSLAFILFEILHLRNCDVKFQNFQRAITQKKSYDFFLKFHHIIYSLYSISC